MTINMMPRALAVILAFACTGLTATGPAQAHALLLSSTPKAGATVPGPAVDFALRYNSRIDAGRSRLQLRDQSGTSRRLPAAAGDTPAALTAHADGLAPGNFTLQWEVLSVDGHVSHGELPFTVTAPVTAK